MSNRISTLLVRNLSDVFGENDPGAGGLQSMSSFMKIQFSTTQKTGAFRSRDEIDGIAVVIKATHPDFKYQPMFPPEESGEGLRVRWLSGVLGKPPALRGNRFYRRPEWPHCFDLSLFRRSSLRQNCATSMVR